MDAQAVSHGKLTLVKGLLVKAQAFVPDIVHCPRPGCTYKVEEPWGKAERILSHHLLTAHRGEFGLPQQAGEVA